MEFIRIDVEATAEALRKMIFAKYSVVSIVSSSIRRTPASERSLVALVPAESVGNLTKDLEGVGTFPGSAGYPHHNHELRTG